MTVKKVETQWVPFRLLRMGCCEHLLCWVNPRLPNYCPECGKHCYPTVRSWVVTTYADARLTYIVEE
jgi:hypothetical protein